MEPVFPMPEPDPGATPFGPEVDRCLALLAEGEKRKQQLVNIQASVAQLRARTEGAIKQFEDDVKALRQQLVERDHTARTAQQRLGCLYAVLVHLVGTCERVFETEVLEEYVGPIRAVMTEARELIAAARPYLK